MIREDDDGTVPYEMIKKTGKMMMGVSLPAR